MSNQVKMGILATLLAVGAGYGACVMSVDDADESEQELGTTDPLLDAGVDAMPLPNVPPELPEVNDEPEIPTDVPEGVLVQCGDGACAPGQACCSTNHECVDPDCDGCCAGTMIQVANANAGDIDVSLPEGVGISCNGNQCEPNQTCCPSSGECVDPDEPEACDQDTYVPVPVPPSQTGDGEGPAGPMPPPIP